MPPSERKKALILVRTYPTPAKNGVEVSCTAAITEDGKWLRLFPVPYRFLDIDKRFRKYQWIEVNVTKANDGRPESYKLDRNSIEIVSDVLPTDNNWKKRKDVVYPLKAHCICCLKRERDANKHPTLGIFKPKVIEQLIIKPTDPNWSQGQLEILRQNNLFESGPTQELEKVPFNFSYRFYCDEQTCIGHTYKCVDWEMGESWRRWSKEYGDEWETKFRQRYETEMIHRNDTHFYVGTVHQHPHTWIIVGLFYPAKDKPMPLFDSAPPNEY
ncbi:MAG TPA: hypothetical protein DC047_12475 [Blastocatellia bacterium]|nr:hypothetical protein [Blastocatellia bacterium]